MGDLANEAVEAGMIFGDDLECDCGEMFSLRDGAMLDGELICPKCYEKIFGNELNKER